MDSNKNLISNSVPIRTLSTQKSGRQGSLFEVLFVMSQPGDVLHTQSQGNELEKQRSQNL